MEHDDVARLHERLDEQFGILAGIRVDVAEIKASCGPCKELVGNCHHNLVKKKESNGKKVSMWKTDDYFYYAKGVALAMSQILAAAVVDFEEELELVRGTQLLQEVVANLYEASQLDPFIVLNGRLDGLRANHRANMAVPVGEALFKLSNLLKY